MATAIAISQIPRHARSISLPSKSHPLTQCVEEQLCELRDAETTSSSTSICHNLGTLKDLYDRVDDLLQLPLAQHALAHERCEKCVEDVFDGSLRLLDVCGTIRDVLSQTKEHVLDLQSTLRRRKGEFDLGNEVSAYMFSKKKVNKEIRKCLEGLKRMEIKSFSSSLLEEDYDHVAIVSILKEVEMITLMVFKSLLSFVSGPKAQSKSSGWSLVSKLMQNKRVACEMVHADISEMENANVALSILINLKTIKGIEVVQAKNVQKRLEELDASIHGLEDGLECVFRRLIRTRVSLLNILNH